MAPTRSSGDKKPPPPKADRVIAMAIYVVTGLLVGLAIGVFTGKAGWVWLGIGLVAGLLVAFLRTRPKAEIEED